MPLPKPSQKPDRGRLLPMKLTRQTEIDPPFELDRGDFFDSLTSSNRFSRADLKRIEAAYELGQQLHQGQKRASGADYFHGHCLIVAQHLHRLEMEPNLIIAGLLHDTIEDTGADAGLLKKHFGPDVAFLVDSVSNLGVVKYRYYDRHVASLRKFFVAVAKDVRVVILKLCDRYHNLQTLRFLPKTKQKRIAKESMLIHGQLAARLNMSQLAQQINDAAFAVVDPESYQKVTRLRKSALGPETKIVEALYRDLLTQLTPRLGYQPTIKRRIKGIYSLHRKLQQTGGDISPIADLIALRVVVDSDDDCYKSLGPIHNRWQPVTGRFKDYIASPKPNGYQSLHTTVFSGHGGAVEIQIRTRQMDRLAEYGIASHYNYKAGSARPDHRPKEFSWLDQLGQLDLNQPQSQYLKELRTDFFSDRIFVMTPKGDVIDLPQGATALDFAFAVHSQLGLTAKGAKINEVYKALKTPLADNDLVEITTQKSSRPTRAWLDWVQTAAAKQKIRAFLAKSKSAG